MVINKGIFNGALDEEDVKIISKILSELPVKNELLFQRFNDKNRHKYKVSFEPLVQGYELIILFLDI